MTESKRESEFTSLYTFHEIFDKVCTRFSHTTIKRNSTAKWCHKSEDEKLTRYKRLLTN